jgi:hypothetical protein
MNNVMTVTILILIVVLIIAHLAVVMELFKLVKSATWVLETPMHLMQPAVQTAEVLVAEMVLSIQSRPELSNVIWDPFKNPTFIAVLIVRFCVVMVF